MEALLGLTLEQIGQICLKEGLPRFAAGQIAQWLYRHRVRSIEQMTNLSKAARERLSAAYEVGVTEPSDVICSADGTKKYLFGSVEAVMIPDQERATLCVSSQKGCKMACKFCMTGRGGFHGQLSVAEIISQYVATEEAERLTNTVFMGMGEPMDNWENVKQAIEVLTAPWGFGWSPKRITLSTIGAHVERFLDEGGCHLAVSLHNPFPEERLQIMPMEKAWPIRQTVETIRRYDWSGQRRVSFEYTLCEGINDSRRHADGLISLLRGLECRVNLIRCHRIPDSPYGPPSQEVIGTFERRLNDAGIRATLRASRGEDILAACGMLAGKKGEKI